MKFHILPINGFMFGFELDKTTPASDYKYILNINFFLINLWIEIRRRK